MLTAKTKILIGAFTKNPPAGTPVSPPTFVPFNVYIFPDPAEKSGAYQLALRSRDLTAFLELPGPFNVVSESSIPQTYVNSHSHHFRTAPPTSDDYIDDYYSFSALRACAISLGRHDLEELCKLKLDDVLAGRYLTPISKNRMVRAEMVPLQTPFHFHVVNINTPVSASLSPRSDNAFSPTYSRGPRVKEEPTSPPSTALNHSAGEERRRPAPMLLSSANKNIGLAILSPGLPPRATTDPDSRKQLFEADAIRAQQLALIEERRNQQTSRTSSSSNATNPGTPGKRTPKTLSTNPRSTKRARAPPNITIDGSAGKSNPDLSIQSAPLYPPRDAMFNHTYGDTGPMTSTLYHKESSTFPYSIPSRRPPSDPLVPHSSNHDTPYNHEPRSRGSPPRLPPISAHFNPIPPTPQTPSSHHAKTARRWIDGKSIRPRRRAHSDQDEPSSAEDSDEAMTLQLGDKVTLTKLEWLQRGQDLLERAWHDMVLHEKGKQQHQQQQHQHHQHS